MIRYILIIFIVLNVGTTFSQVNVSLWHPLATDTDSSRTKYVNLGILQSKANNISGLSFNTLGGNVTGTLRGVLLSGIYSYTEKSLKGISFGGLLNVVKGGGKGIALSGILNMNVEAFKGFQISAISNLAIKEIRGFQISAIHNVAASSVSGIQISGISNLAAEGSRTMQLSGIFNISLERLKGLQIAPANFADTIKGVQIGILNVSRKVEKGVQLGVINFHEGSTGLHLAFLNMTPRSKIHMLLSSGNFTLINVASMIRNRNNYVILGVGISYDRVVDFSGAFYVRRGYSFPLKRFKINADYGFAHIMAFDDANYRDIPMLRYSLQPRLGLEYKLHNRLSLFVNGGYALTSLYGYWDFEKKVIAEAGIILF